MILNLKKLNKYIESKYFKMESSQHVLYIVQYMGLDYFCGFQIPKNV